MNDTLAYDKKAKDLLLDVYQTMDNVEIPVNLDKIAEFLGLEAMVFYKESVKENWENISGALDRTNRTIYINGSERYERQTFTLAHEIGHYLIHDNHRYDILYRDDLQKYPQNKDQRECEADAFAASLIMPKGFVKTLWNINSDISEIANVFGVSETTAMYRLKNLDLLTE